MPVVHSTSTYQNWTWHKLQGASLLTIFDNDTFFMMPASIDCVWVVFGGKNCSFTLFSSTYADGRAIIKNQEYVAQFNNTQPFNEKHTCHSSFGIASIHHRQPRVIPWKAFGFLECPITNSGNFSSAKLPHTKTVIFFLILSLFWMPLSYQEGLSRTEQFHH